MAVFYLVPPAIYGDIDYGQVKYGQVGVPYPPPPVLVSTAPTPIRAVTGSKAQWLAEPFRAQSMNYGAVGVSWTKPIGIPARWRLISNRYGYPVDQNDGNVLIDQPDWPGTFYLDQSVIPGSYVYYGLYAQTDAVNDIWLRVAVTGCLANANTGKASWLQSHLPEYFSKYLNGSLSQDAAGNTYLTQFLEVLGWGLDYVQTQYDMVFKHVNDPMAIPVNDLANLATELGLPFDPMISVFLMRKAAANWAHVAQERGTPLGIGNQIELLTGFGVDLQIGPNLMLDNDQSYFPDPSYAAWSKYTSYQLGEIITYSGFVYSCLIAGTVGTAPTGLGTSNANWQVVLDQVEPLGLLTNASTGGISTWEAVYPAQTNGIGPAGTLNEGIGETDPAGGAAVTFNALQVVNQKGTSQDVIVRSVSRTTDEKALTTANPDGMLLGPILNQNWDFETSTAPWTAINSATLTWSNLWSHTNTHSAAIQGNGSTANPAMTSETILVQPGKTYVISGWFNAIGGSWTTCSILVKYLDNAGGTISGPTSALTFNQTALTPGFQYTEVTTPATCFGIVVYVQMTGTPGAVIGLFTDDLQVQAQNWLPDNLQAINDGIPVPFTRPSQTWSPTVRYRTGAVVTYNGQPFQARRASTGATPPFGRTPSAEWYPLSTDQRLRLMVSGATRKTAIPVTPFVEWYDNWGNLITRVTARTPTPGTPGIPDKLAFDGFLLSPGSSIAGRSFDNGYSSTWTAQDNNFTVSPFQGGVAYPNSTARSVALTTVPANGQVGVTFASLAGGGLKQGIVFRWSGETNYWKATTAALIKNVAGVFTTVATYASPANAGDRLVVQMNGNAITVLLNGVPVASTTDSFNSSATLAGMIVE